MHAYIKHALTFLLSSFLVLPACDCLLPAAHAQGGWQWGEGNGDNLTIISYGYAAAADGIGNAYGGGVNYGGFVDSPMKFGPITVPNTAGGTAGTPIQAFWVKYTSGGTPVWADGTQIGNAWLIGLSTDPGNNLVVFGCFSSPTLVIDGITLTNVYGTTGQSQYFVAKYNQAGTLLWAINDGNVGAAYTPDVLGNFFVAPGISFQGVPIQGIGGVTTDPSGNIYVTSRFDKPSMTIGSNTLLNTDPTGATADIFIAEYSPSGTLLWAKGAGGPSDDFSYGIAVGYGGNLFVTGAFWSSSFVVGSYTILNPYASVGYISGASTYGDVPLAYIAEFSSAGTPLQAVAMGDSAGAFAAAIAGDASGNIYVTGGFVDTSIILGGDTAYRPYPSDSSLSMFVAQYTPGHSVGWVQAFGSPTQPVVGVGIATTCGTVWASGGGTGGGTAGIPGTTDSVFLEGYNSLTGAVVANTNLISGGQGGVACDPVGNAFLCDYYSGAPIPFGIADTLPVFPGEFSFYLAKYDNPSLVSSDTSTFDTTCTNGLFTLRADTGYTTYFWSTDSTGITMSDNFSGVYWVMESNCARLRTDTFHEQITPVPVIIATSNSPVCTGIYDTLFLQATSNPGATYNWLGPDVLTTVVQNPLRTPAIMEMAGVYQVTATLNGCTSPIAYDTVIILQTPLAPWVKDTNYCQYFDAPPLQAWGDSVLWYKNSNIGGDTGVLLPPTPPTADDTLMWFYTTSTVMGCFSQVDSFSITVNPKPLLTVSPYVNLCPGDSAILVATDTNPFDILSWSPPMYLNDTVGATVVTKPLTSTSYLVTTQNQFGCFDTASTSVTVEAAATIYLGDSVSLYLGQSYQISPQTNCVNFLWYPAAGLSGPSLANPTASPFLSTRYYVFCSTQWGCATEDSLDINILYKSPVAVPNAFTPGNGGPNAIFNIIIPGKGVLNYFRIYDRWGVQVFETTDSNQGWDGTYKGTPQPFGVYVYEVNGVTDEGTPFSKRGNVTLLR